MKNSSLLILSATPRTNFTLAQHIQEEAKKMGLDSKILDLESLQLPLYTPEVEDSQELPKQAVQLTQEMIAHRAVVLLAPEYNGGLPSVVVNAISWVSRSSSDWREAFQMKPFLIGSASGGGGQKVLQVMSIQLQHLGAIILPRPVLVTANKPFNPDSVQANLRWLKDYLG